MTRASKLKTILESLNESVSLLIEMKESREHAFALYQDFSIVVQSGIYDIRVSEYDTDSSAGHSLTLTPDIPGFCKSIFYKSYYSD